MSVLDHNESTSNWWNYSKPDKAGFSVMLAGVLKLIQIVQAREFGTKEPKFWPDGKPVQELRFTITDANGIDWNFQFKPGSKKHPSAMMEALKKVDEGNIKNLLGKTIKITTVAPPAGFNYGAGNPRPFTVDIIDNTVKENSGVIDWTTQESKPAPTQQQSDNNAAPFDPYAADIPF